MIFHLPWLPIKDISPSFVQPSSAGCALAWPPSRTLSLASLPMSQRSRFFRPQIWFLPGGYLKMEFNLKTHWKTVTTAMRYSTLVMFPSLCQPGGQVESHDAPAGHHTLHLPTHCRLASHIYAYLIFVIFLYTHFESCKFYTWKVRKFTTKLPSDKTASLSVKFYTECNIYKTLCWGILIVMVQ